ncbi:hypothetical protein NAS92_04190 [Pantoea brenneri]|uniref:hypothetical protein n=1 Tax=Pantoea brenneri TaxID=472694 RepID=UPI00210B559C|nr:hypothetical protein [Pantoea brenneri]MCQ5469681.1 hypothetical protein [Pantoea brenneri]
MKKMILAFLISIMAASVNAADKSHARNFIDQVTSAAEGSGQLSEQIVVSCLAPSASGTFLITKASYEVGKNLGVYVFKNNEGQDATLNWIGAKFENDDLSSDVIVGYDFGFTIPNGQFFLTVMKSGEVKAGVSKNSAPGIKEVDCEPVDPN